MRNLETPLKLYRNPLFWLSPLVPFHFRYYEGLRNESRVSLDEFLLRLEDHIEIDDEQVKAIEKKVSGKKPYDAYTPFLGYRGTGNMNYANIGDQEMTINFWIYGDGTIGSIYLYSNHIFSPGFPYEEEWVEPGWLEEAYQIAENHGVCFQNSEMTNQIIIIGSNQRKCHFHSGFETIYSGLDKTIEKMEAIKKAERVLTEIIKYRKNKDVKSL